MPKKKWSAEDKAVLSAKIRAVNRKKEADLKEKLREEILSEQSQNKSQQDILLETLVKMVDEMQSQRATPNSVGGLSLNSSGEVSGVINRYPIEKDFYPDPTQELKDMPELVRFGFKENYDLVWEVYSQAYKTATNIWYNEPWHIIHLYMRQWDENGEPAKALDENGNQDEVVIEYRTGYFFEDDVIVQQEANRLGLVDFDASDLANQLRLHRMKTWLRSIFYPPKAKPSFSDKQVIVGGQVVIQTSRSKVLSSLPDKNQIRL